MCFSKPKPDTNIIAAPPAAPLGSPDVPEIGKRRRQETMGNLGEERPTYRKRNDDGSRIPVSPDSGRITM
jgi:hypothetical protein